MTMKNPLATVWWVNAGLLAALLVWWLSVFRTDWQPPAPLIPDYSAVLDGALLPGQLSAKDYPVTIQKPIFEVERTWPKDAPKPETKPEEPPPPPKNALDDVVLQGIFDQAGTGIAIFSAQGKSHRLKTGDTYEEWTLTGIDPMSASFSHPTLGEKTVTIKRRMDSDPAASKPETSAAAQGSNGRNAVPSLFAPRRNEQAAPPPARPNPRSADEQHSEAPRRSSGPSIGGSAPLSRIPQ